MGMSLCPVRQNQWILTDKPKGCGHNATFVDLTYSNMATDAATIDQRFIGTAELQGLPTTSVITTMPSPVSGSLSVRAVVFVILGGIGLVVLGAIIIAWLFIRSNPKRNAPKSVLETKHVDFEAALPPLPRPSGSSFDTTDVTYQVGPLASLRYSPREFPTASGSLAGREYDGQSTYEKSPLGSPPDGGFSSYRNAPRQPVSPANPFESPTTTSDVFSNLYEMDAVGQEIPESRKSGNGDDSS